MRFPTWSKFILIIVVTAGILLPGIVQADDDMPYLTWEDAPVTQPMRHQGDAQVRWGWETPELALGPFFQEPFQVGDHTTFHITSDRDNFEFVLLHRSEHAYFWFEIGADVDMNQVMVAADRFDNDIWELNRYLFGENASPGIDGDMRIHIVHIESLLPGLAGFFSPDDQCASHICRGSNERDALYIMLDYGPVSSNRYLSTLAHEFQHMIQFNTDGNEYRWLDEGLSQLAEHLHGFGDDPINSINAEVYLNTPNMYLNSWSYNYDSQSAYYGAGYLMAVYLYERFGAEFIRELTRNSLDGLAGIHNVLQTTGQNITVDELITDWWIANYIDNPYVGDGRYYYQTLDMPREVANERIGISDQPVTHRGLLHQYGVEYLEISRPGTYRLTFSGDAETPLTLLEPHSGQWVWWSYNASGSATSLTRTIDLTETTKASLKYWIAGETGRFPGYLHVLISTDGQHWDILQGTSMDVFNRFSEAPGPHYAGVLNTWEADFIDLNDYVGQEVLLRFEYVTNNAIAGPGFMLDDISIPEIGWYDDFETIDEEWMVEGFLHTQESVDQNWTLAAVADGDMPQVQIINVEEGQAEAEIIVPEDGSMIIVGAMAPFASIDARYTLTITPVLD